VSSYRGRLGCSTKWGYPVCGGVLKRTDALAGLTEVHPRSRKLVLFALSLVSTCVALLSAPLSFAQDDSDQILTIDHYIQHVSTVPAIAGQHVQLYLRERVQAGTALRSVSSTPVVLFVHGAGSGSVGFDLRYEDYSWMAYVAQAGFDAFGLDLTGYGSSTRPALMDEPCNASPAQQALLVPVVIPQACSPTLSTQLTTIPSDWDDIGSAVDYLRGLRDVDRVSFVSWSLGGTRAAGYAALHPEKVDRLVMLAPGYDTANPTSKPPEGAEAGVPMSLQARASWVAGMDGMVHCDDQVDPATRDPFWEQIQASDSVGAGWGPGMVRSPSAPGWRWNTSVAAKVQAPTLLVSGEFDSLSIFSFPDTIRAAYTDLGTSHKVFMTLACSSHFAPYERRHSILFQASVDWLQNGSINGMSEGTLRLGD